MNRDKQIVYKMIEDICPFYKDGMCNANLPLKPFECRHNCGSAIIGAVVYGKGYRKASDVASAIFEEIDKIIDKHYNRHIFGVEDLSDVEQEAVMNFSGDVTYEIAELKKKYTEGMK